LKNGQKTVVRMQMTYISPILDEIWPKFWRNSTYFCYYFNYLSLKNDYF